MLSKEYQHHGQLPPQNYWKYAHVPEAEPEPTTWGWEVITVQFRLDWQRKQEQTKEHATQEKNMNALLTTEASMLLKHTFQ